LTLILDQTLVLDYTVSAKVDLTQWVTKLKAIGLLVFFAG